MQLGVRIGDSKVLESRETPDGSMIRRRRVTADGRRFTTYERVEMPPLSVMKGVVIENLLIETNYILRLIVVWVSSFIQSLRLRT